MRYRGTIRKLFNNYSGVITFEKDNSIEIIHFYNEYNTLMYEIGKTSLFLFDEVMFSICSNLTKENDIIATDLEIIGNDKMQYIHSIIGTDNIIQGYFRKINNSYYIKEVNTKMFFKLLLPYGSILPSDNLFIRAKVDNDIKSLRNKEAFLEDVRYQKGYLEFMEQKQLVHVAIIKNIQSKSIIIDLPKFGIEGCIIINGTIKRRLKQIYLANHLYVVLIDKQYSHLQRLLFNLTDIKDSSNK